MTGDEPGGLNFHVASLTLRKDPLSGHSLLNAISAQ